MRTRILQLAALFFFMAIVTAGCRSSRDGCPGARTSGERYKASKFSWN